MTSFSQFHALQDRSCTRQKASSAQHKPHACQPKVLMQSDGPSYTLYASASSDVMQAKSKQRDTQLCSQGSSVSLS